MAKPHWRCLSHRFCLLHKSFSMKSLEIVAFLSVCSSYVSVPELQCRFHKGCVLCEWQMQDVFFASSYSCRIRKKKGFYFSVTETRSKVSLQPHILKTSATSFQYMGLQTYFRPFLNWRETTAQSLTGRPFLTISEYFFSVDFTNRKFSKKLYPMVSFVTIRVNQ